MDFNLLIGDVSRNYPLASEVTGGCAVIGMEFRGVTFWWKTACFEIPLLIVLCILVYSGMVAEVCPSHMLLLHQAKIEVASPQKSSHTCNVIWRPGHNFISEATLLLVSIISLNGPGIYSSLLSPQFIADNWRLCKANVLTPHRKLLQRTWEAGWMDCIMCHWAVRDFSLNKTYFLLIETLPECIKWCNQLF